MEHMTYEELKSYSVGSAPGQRDGEIEILLYNRRYNHVLQVCGRSDWITRKTFWTEERARFLRRALDRKIMEVGTVLILGPSLPLDDPRMKAYIAAGLGGEEQGVTP